MKKLLIIATCMLASMAAYAQGTVTFANSASTLVKYGSEADGVPAALAGTSVGSGVAGGDFRTAIYWQNPTTTLFEVLTTVADPISGATGFNSAPGRFNGGERRTGSATPGGNTATFMVKVWSAGATYSSFDAALASGDPSVYVGASLPFVNGTGNPGGTPPTLASAIALSSGGGFTGITNVRPVPEPSIVALGLLGAAALLIRRRN